MIIVTTETIPGKTITEALEIVRGSTVRARNVGRDIMAGFKNIVGGEVSEYTELLAHAREQSLQRMKNNAQNIGADAIVNVRFMTSTVAQGMAEILVYGTAVKIK